MKKMKKKEQDMVVIENKNSIKFINWWRLEREGNDEMVQLNHYH